MGKNERKDAASVSVNTNEKMLLEEKINNSPLFGIDKEAEPYKYDLERNRLFAHIGDYVNKFYFRKYGDFGYEQAVAFQNSVKSYKAEKGVFLAYYMTSLENACHVQRGKEIAATMTGNIHLTASQQRVVCSIRKILEAKGIVDEDINDDVIKRVAKIMNADYSKMKKAFDIYQNSKVVGMTTVVDGDELNTIDKFGENVKSAEDIVFEKLGCYEVLDIIERKFLYGIQVRQREVISPCLTALIAGTVLSESLDVSKYQFVDHQMIKDYENGKEVPLRKDIAEMLHKAEPSISRTMGNFLIELAEELKRENVCK